MIKTVALGFEVCLHFYLIQDQRTAVHWAAQSECDGPEKLHFLFQKGVSVNIQSKVSFIFIEKFYGVIFVDQLYQWHVHLEESSQLKQAPKF